MAKTTGWKNLQNRADAALAQAVERLEALGYDHYDIIPRVRLTNNRRMVGSATDVNRAIVRVAGKRGERRVLPGKSPLFEISVSRSEFDNPHETLDVFMHEVIHCCPDCQNHGRRFKSIAAHANRVYGTHVSTTKTPLDEDGNPVQEKAADAESRARDRERSARAKSRRSELERKLAPFVGKTFQHGSKRYTLDGFNPRNRKNTCELTAMDGRKYKAPPELVARAFDVV